MLKIFVTGDNHFGRKYDRFPDVKEKLINSRFESLQGMVREAEKDGCELFVVTGDLFDNVNTIKVSDVKKVADILAAFSGTVLILPGNHDCYTKDEKVWQDFENALGKTDHNIVILNEFREYPFDTAQEHVVIYPAFCQSKHSGDNNLSWIKNAKIDSEAAINIGIAHGAIQGITPDKNQEYFLMSEAELSSIPVDAWLIGHTHITFPSDLKENTDTTGYKIFNAGTHEQLDFHNNTEGNSFIITIEKTGSKAVVSARRFISGRTRFYDISVPVKADSENSLKAAVEAAASSVSAQKATSIIRLTVSGTAKQAEYENRAAIYKETLKDFMTYEISDSELSEEITIEKIRSEFAETSFASQFMEALIDDPAELQMAYQLINDCREK